MENKYLPDKEIDAHLIELGNELRANGIPENTISSVISFSRGFIVMGGFMAANNAMKEISRILDEHTETLRQLIAVTQEKCELELQNKELKCQLKIIKLQQLCNSQDK